MPLPIQRGAFADSLRQLFRLTGRIPVNLDENVVPVAIVGDASGLPYTGDPIYWQAYGSGGPVAAELSVVGVGPVVGLNGCLIVDRIDAINIGVSAVMGSVRFQQLTGIGLAVGQAPLQVNQLDLNRIIGANYQTVPAQTVTGTEAALAGVQLLRFQLPAGTQLSIPGPWVLPADVALSVWASSLPNYRIDVNFAGRYFADVIG